VDDVLIMSKASFSEWQEIHTLLNAFCGATGLMINVNKSTFLHYGVQQGLLDDLKFVVSLQLLESFGWV
jgi:hypothetical protein